MPCLIKERAVSHCRVAPMVPGSPTTRRRGPAPGPSQGGCQGSPTPVMRLPWTALGSLVSIYRSGDRGGAKTGIAKGPHQAGMHSATGPSLVASCQRPSSRSQTRWEHPAHSSALLEIGSTTPLLSGPIGNRHLVQRQFGLSVHPNRPSVRWAETHLNEVNFAIV